MDSPAISQIHTLCLQMERHLSTPFPFSLWAKHCHYSPYHLRHLFTETIGVPPHQYLRRRRMTEAARQLVFSSQPLLEIAFLAGYESQQAFSDAFRRLYHMSPARFRARGFFYPLQLFPEEPFLWTSGPKGEEALRLATQADIPDWMALAHLSIDGYPCWIEGAYRAALSAAISDQRAWVWAGQEMLGIATLAPQGDHLAYWAVHPRLRHRGGLQRLLTLLRTNRASAASRRTHHLSGGGCR